MRGPKEVAMDQACKACGGRLEEGFLFGTKDGALSFAHEVPSAFENAGNAPGFAKVATLKAGGRVSSPACICRACGTVTVKIEESLR